MIAEVATDVEWQNNESYECHSKLKIYGKKEYSVASFQLATRLVLVPIHHKLTDKTTFLNKQI